MTGKEALKQIRTQSGAGLVLENPKALHCTEVRLRVAGIALRAWPFLVTGLMSWQDGKLKQGKCGVGHISILGGFRQSSSGWWGRDRG